MWGLDELGSRRHYMVMCAQSTAKPTVEDVARRAGVSRSAASLALRKHPKAASFRSDTLARVNEAATELGYRPNFFQLRRNSSQVIMIYVENLQDAHSSAIAEGFQQCASDRGYLVTLSVGKPKESDSLFDQRIIGNHGISAVVVIGSLCKRLQKKELATLAKEGVSVAVVGHNVDGPNLSKVLFDEYRGGHLVGEHIASLGSRRVCMMTAPNASQARLDRVRGVLDALEEHGVPKPIELRMPGQNARLRGPWGLEMASHDVMAKYLKACDQKPEAVIANTDLRAYGACRAIYEAGYRPGFDIAVTGYSDIWPSQMTYPPLSTVCDPKAEMGQAAADTLIDMIEGKSKSPRTVVFEPKLVVRESTSLWRPSES